MLFIRITDPSILRVVAGEHSLTQTSGNEQIRSVSTIKMHANYNSDTFENDIALLKVSLNNRIQYFLLYMLNANVFLFPSLSQLSSPLDFSTGKVGPINLPAQGATIDAGTTCLVTGWGTTIVHTLLYALY